MHVFWQTLFIFAWAVLFAILEIEAEGKYGWAEQMPTWYRKGLYYKVMNKPLTGYHLAMFPIPLMFFFWPMVSTWTLSWTGTFAAVGMYFAFTITWDYAWFVLNPYYGPRNFRRDKVWWFGQEHWLGGRIPSSYILAWAMSLTLAAFSSWAGDTGASPFWLQIQQLSWFCVLMGFLVLIGRPLYGRYWRAMRQLGRDARPDVERYFPTERD